MKRSVLTIMILFILFVAYSFAEGLYPKSSGNMERTLYITGEEAIESVMKLHRGSDIELEDAVVCEYKGANGANMIIWASLSGNKNEANILLDRMNKKMPSSKMYRDFRSFMYKGQEIFSVKGMGMENYYFVRGKWNYWIAIKNADSENILKTFLDKLRD
jgi:hypothetical protein